MYDVIVNNWFCYDVAMSSTGLLRVYRNGTLSNSSNLANSLNLSLNVTRIGAYATSTNPFLGYFGALKIYSKELSAQEVAENYNSSLNLYQ